MAAKAACCCAAASSCNAAASTEPGGKAAAANAGGAAARLRCCGAGALAVENAGPPPCGGLPPRLPGRCSCSLEALCRGSTCSRSEEAEWRGGGGSAPEAGAGLPGTKGAALGARLLLPPPQLPGMPTEPPRRRCVGAAIAAIAACCCGPAPDTGLGSCCARGWGLDWMASRLARARASGLT